jgi:hypothetical protein
MSSFQQLKAKRDKRHPVYHAESELVEFMHGSSSSDTDGLGKPGPSLPEGVEVRTDQKRGRGLYATGPHIAGIYVSEQLFPLLITSHRLQYIVGYTPTGGLVYTELILGMFRMPPHAAGDRYQDRTQSLAVAM